MADSTMARITFFWSFISFARVAAFFAAPPTVGVLTLQPPHRVPQIVDHLIELTM
jgi:hypothetical protein